MFGLTTIALSSGMINKLNPLGNMFSPEALMGFLIVFLIIGIAIYIYSALAWQTIAKKLGYKYAWLAWIPIANFFLLPILANKSGWWGLILVVPIVLSFTFKLFYGILYYLGVIFIGIMSIMWLWKVYTLRGYPGWLSLLPIFIIIPILGFLVIISHLIVIGIVAWKDRMPTM